MAMSGYVRAKGRIKRAYMNGQLLNGSNKKSPNAEFMKGIRDHQRQVQDTASEIVPTTELRLSYWLAAVQQHGDLTKDINTGKAWDSKGNPITEKRDIAPPLVAKIFRENLVRLWQSDRRQRLQTFNCIVLQKGKHTEARVYFCGTEFIILEQSFSLLKRSIIYSSFALAKKAYDARRVLWVEQGINVMPDRPS